ncbi:DUF2076 domain-containing protein [Methylomonas sp. LW13]|uniref:DUF2076 domain-containing protein n=1 Tax=unclassified Methylomonas TaxID=2608980 RepID=UPI00051ACFB0|nr:MULTISPECIES: DUF2076 domain-containing protein [unclassified Methylomonas]NOV30229.1 DUF2076 domain-containing protein [Methylomonas sp. ZR1]PKD37928.1 DUF2076 domain-containing protein [Methylomonas sp. Kb3]QBC28321.1 DUF2076 domain-containing protein [Methylomonas sp. LW13]
MNSQERNQLSQFLNQLNEVKLTQKDAEAEALIRDAVAKQPDAAYLLVQRALLQDQALTAAKAQIAELQNQLQAGANPQRGGFLGNDPWAQPANNSGAVPGAGNYQMPRGAAPAQAPGFFGGGGGSFLGNVATTAAGVVAGSFLFQGIESLMGHHGSSAWGQQAMGEHSGLQEQTVVNNYYGDDAIQQANLDNSDDFSLSDADYSVPDDSDDSDWI